MDRSVHFPCIGYALPAPAQIGLTVRTIAFGNLRLIFYEILVFVRNGISSSESNLQGASDSSKTSAGKADFADYLILGRAESEALRLRTFDKTLLKEVRG